MDTEKGYKEDMVIEKIPKSRPTKHKYIDFK